MKEFTVGELKANFSKILEDIKKGQKVTISYGKQKQKLAIIVPYQSYVKKDRKLGLYENKVEYKISKNFKLTDEEFLNS